MAKVRIDTKEAVRQLNDVLKKTNELKNSMSSMNKPTSEAFNDLANTIRGMKKEANNGTASIFQLNDSIKENKKNLDKLTSSVIAQSGALKQMSASQKKAYETNREFNTSMKSATALEKTRLDQYNKLKDAIYNGSKAQTKILAKNINMIDQEIAKLKRLTETELNRSSLSLKGRQQHVDFLTRKYNYAVDLAEKKSAKFGETVVRSINQMTTKEWELVKMKEYYIEEEKKAQAQAEKSEAITKRQIKLANEYKSVIEKQAQAWRVANQKQVEAFEKNRPSNQLRTKMSSLRGRIEDGILRGDSPEKIRRLSNEFVVLNERLGKAQLHFKSLGEQAPSALQKLQNSMSATTTKIANLTLSGKNNAREIDLLIKKYQRYKVQMDRVNENLARARGGQEKLTNSFKNARGVLVSYGRQLLSALGIYGAIFIAIKKVRETISLVKDLDAMSYTLQKVTKNAYANAQAWRYLIDISQRYGVNLKEVTARYGKFYAAAQQSGLGVKDTQNIFESFTKVSATLSLRADEMKGVFLALEQMLSKGKVTTEELRRQLGERLPGAMGIMAASMGVTIEELDKMMKKGEVLSAEVLPNFADAVELAFGIDQENKVDNLVAASERMDNAWTMLIKTMTDGDSPIKRMLDGWYERVSDIYDMITRTVESPEQRLSRKVSNSRENSMRFRRENAEEVVNSRIRGNFLELRSLKELRQEMSRLNREESKRVNTAKFNRLSGDEKTAIREKYEERRAVITAEMLKTKVEIDKVEYDEAIGDLDFVQERTEKLKEAFDELAPLQEVIKDKLSWKDFTGGFTFLGKRIEDRSEAISEMGRIIKENDFLYTAASNGNGSITNFDQLELETKEAIADLESINLILSKSNVETKTTNEKESRFKVVKRYDTKERELVVARLEKEQQLISDKLANEELALAERLSLTKDYYNKEELIAKENRAEEEEDAQRYYDNETAKLKKNLREGKIIQEDYSRGMKELKERLQNELLISEQEYQTQSLSNTRTYLNSVVREYENANSRIDRSANLDQNQLTRTTAAKNNALDKDRGVGFLFGINSRKKQAINEKAERDSIIIQINAINQKIQNLEDLKNSGEITKEEYKIQNTLFKDMLYNSEQGLENLITDQDQDKSWSFEDILGKVQEGVSAIGDIYESFLQRRLAQIDKEIEAETEKYDKLISLNEGNNAKQNALEQEKEAKLKKLEKKRRAEERKAAIFRKAQALVDIAINTAIAISAATIKPWMIPVISALGAAQAAAVIAQPIPKYEKGGDISSDHVGMINDGKSKEYVERNGKILSTDKKDAVVDLKSGDVIHPNIESLIKNSILLNQAYGDQEMNYNDIDSTIFGSITDSIHKGFKKAKINNSINIRTKDNSEYRSFQTRWN